MLRQIVLGIAISLAAVPVAAQPGGQQNFTYRGFHIDMSAIPPGPRKAALRRAVVEQIDITARAPLQPRIAQWIRNVPIKLLPGAGRQPGFYTNQPCG